MHFLCPCTCVERQVYNPCTCALDNGFHKRFEQRLPKRFAFEKKSKPFEKNGLDNGFEKKSKPFQRQDKTRQDKTRQDKTRQDKRRQEKNKSSWCVQKH